MRKVGRYEPAKDAAVLNSLLPVTQIVLTLEDGLSTNAAVVSPIKASSKAYSARSWPPSSRHRVFHIDMLHDTVETRRKEHCHQLAKTANYG